MNKILKLTLIFLSSILLLTLFTSAELFKPYTPNFGTMELPVQEIWDWS